MVWGVLLYSIYSDPAYIALGIPIVLTIGVAIGGILDKKAVNEKRILNI